MYSKHERSQADREPRRADGRRVRVRGLEQALHNPGLTPELGQQPTERRSHEREERARHREPEEPAPLLEPLAPVEQRARCRNQEDERARVRHPAHRPVDRLDRRQVALPPPVLALVLLVQLVQADNLAVEGAGRQKREHLRDLDRERRRLVALREPADLEERERTGLAGVPLRFAGRDLHRLQLGDEDAEVATEPQVHGRHRDEHDQCQLRRGLERLHVPAPGEVPAADAEHDRGSRGQPREDGVPERVERPVAREQRPDASQHGLAVLDLVADRVLHERVCDEDEVGRHPAREHRDPQRRQVQARREPVPAEDPEPEERRLEEERSQPLDRERCAEDVPDVLRVDRPVHAELKLLDEAGGDADREVDQEERAEEAGQPVPALVAGAVPLRLHHRDERPEA